MQACHFLGAGHQAFGGKAEQVGQADADQRRNGSGEQQGADGQEADFAQGRSVVQTGHSAEDRGKYQRDHDHLQQLHIAIADQVKPADRGLEHRVAGAVDRMQRDTKRHAQHQGKQHLLGQAPIGTTGLCQAQ